MALSIEEKYDEVRTLITMGKEKGYLLYEEVNDMLPPELTASDDLDDIFAMFAAMGIEVVDNETKLRDKGEGEEGAEIDLTPGALDKTNDPVRMYLREMGTVPLLTREGEVEIAKRIERGKKAVLRVISRTPMAATELQRLGERLAKAEISVRELVVFNEEEITEEKLAAKVRQTLKLVDEVRKAHENYLALRTKFAEVGRRDPKYAKSRWKLGRARIAMSHAFRRMELSEALKRRLTERIRDSVDRVRMSEDKINVYEGKLKGKVSEEYKKGVRKLIHDQKEQVGVVEAEFDAPAEELKQFLDTLLLG
ncbi:MAG: RNA polymerase sigma factor RpoD, partial [Vicinamibacteria bacterium]|nr:RNA polymerase sigma factor RpoD [Vicinamibacteria bacterium]